MDMRMDNNNRWRGNNTMMMIRRVILSKIVTILFI